MAVLTQGDKRSDVLWQLQKPRGEEWCKIK